MIQRIQTVYFILVMLICSAMFFVPIYKGSGKITDIELKQTAVKSLIPSQYETMKLWPVVLNALDILVLSQALVCIILYATRKIQLKMTRFTLVLSMIYLIVLFFAINAANGLESNNDHTYLIGTWLPILSPILLFLASLGISKDIKLVKSADRLR